MNLLYVTLNPREKLGGLVLLALYLLILPLLSAGWQFLLFMPVLFGLCLWTFWRFLLDSFQVPLVSPWQILGKAVLAALISQLSRVLTNDLIYYFLPGYFLYTDLGPLLYNSAWEWAAPLVRENPVLAAVCLTLFLPVVEELLLRGLLFGHFYRRTPLFGFLLTLTVCTVLRLLPVFGRDPVYLGVCALQYIPMTIYLSWVYVRSDTIAAPMTAHVLINAVSLYILRSYYA
ncbi:MAG: CPBP family intramembrane metalloprotease [Ruminococcaceae bacterium]|nr:CPBP family intramembrane metalloprotease [Oscillospiraceae bacterium]